MKRILSIAVISVIASANTLSFFGGGISYKKSIKKYGNFAGLYFTNYKKNSSSFFELNYKKLFINYKKTFNNYSSNKLSIVLNQKFSSSLFNIMPYVSYSGIWEKQYNKNFSKVYNLGARFFNVNTNLIFNPSIYYSCYKDFNVIQPTFSIGYYYYPNLIDNDIGYFYIQGNVNYIKFTKRGVMPKNSYKNYDISITNFYKNLQTTIKGSFGKFAYKNENKGFITYNFKEEYKYEYNIDVMGKINNKYFVGINFDYLKLTKNYNNAETLTGYVYIGKRF